NVHTQRDAPDPDGRALDGSDLDRVGAEARAIRELLERQSLLYRSTVRPIPFEPAEPPLVRAFWETVGWAPLFAAGRITNPHAAPGITTVRQRLAEYGTEEHFTLTEADLPSRYRLVYADNDGIGFAVTDEREGVADPAVLSVLWDDNEIVPYAPSYLRLSAEAVLSAAFDSWYSLWLTAPTERTLVPGGGAAERPFPLLAPGAHRLDPDRWLLRSTEQSGPTTAWLLAATGFEHLVEWLHGQDLGGLRIARLPGDTLRRTGPLRVADGTPVRLSGSDAPDPDRSLRAGWIGGIAVIVEERGDRLTIAVNPRHRAALEGLLDGELL
ncbi:hypothetical protein, partial [Kitasatospora sp. MBT63]|uniref:hypothetical protein n=1 Tax=Kitasatospora sp. MBT63 TaxID=1444768 RepID=UPI000539D635